MKPVFVMIPLLAALQFGLPVVGRGAETAPAIPSAPFDQELYLLGYDVFLANSNPAEAFLLAEKAVASRPGELEWRFKAARSGEWSGNLQRALEHWIYLVDHGGGAEAADSALRLAVGLSSHRHVKRLLEMRGIGTSLDYLERYVAACEALGKLEDAIIGLEPHRRGPHRKYVLETLANLYESAGHPREAIEAYLEQISDYGVTGPRVLRAASLAYGSRDMVAAYTILSLAKHRLPSTEWEYWQNLADLAWSLQDLRTTDFSSQRLMESGKAREEEYQRLILITRDKDPRTAYKFALEGWQRFGLTDFAKVVLELGIRMKEFQALEHFITGLEHASFRGGERDAYYWTLVSQVKRGSGAMEESIASYRNALRLAPGDQTLTAGYIWLLLDLDRREELQRVLESWRGRGGGNPTLNDALGAAHATLGQYGPALERLETALPARRNDPSWLAAYGDILEQSGRPEAAFTARLQALELARGRMKVAPRGDDRDQRTLADDYLRVALLLSPGDATHGLMAELASGRDDDAGRELVAAWVLSTQPSDLARLWFWREYARMTRRPGWIELTLALEADDRPAIARLLEAGIERLPYRDAVEGAVRTGRVPLAETHAFEHLQEHDTDHLLDRQVRDLYGSRQGGFRYHLSLMDQSGIGFLEQQVSVTGAVTGKFSVRLAGGNTDIRHQRNEVIGDYPSSSRFVRLGLLMRHEHGSAEFFGGVRDAVHLHPQGGVTGEWRVDQRLSLDMALLTGVDAPESVGLRIGGMKDEFRIGVVQRLTGRDTALARVSGRTLRDQAWNRLGKGISLEGELDHRLLAAQPDTILRFFGGYHHYSRGGTPAGRTLFLIPPRQRGGADSSFFVPDSFVQVGAGLLVGDEWRQEYLRTWRPFLAADSSWNSASGFGFRYELGLTGPVFGLDKLEGSFSQESGSFGTGDTTSRVDLRYRYYFR